MVERDPNLFTSQAAFKNLSDEILGLDKKRRSTTMMHFGIETDPQ